MMTFLVSQWLISKESRRFFSSRYCSRTPVFRLLYMSSSSHVSVPPSMASRPEAVTGWRYAERSTSDMPLLPRVGDWRLYFSRW